MQIYVMIVEEIGKHVMSGKCHFSLILFINRLEAVIILNNLKATF